MIYTLKHFDTPLISFSADSGAKMNIEITFVDEKKRALFQFDMQEVTQSGIQSWLKHRTVPKNRAYVDSILSSMGLSINRQLDVIRVSKGERLLLGLHRSQILCNQGVARLLAPQNQINFDNGKLFLSNDTFFFFVSFKEIKLKNA